MRAQIAFLFKKFTPELARLTPNKTHCRRTRTPFYGSRRMTAWLQAQGYRVNRKRVARLMRIMGIEAVYAKPKLSQPGEGHKIYPYLLKGLKIERCNQVWCTDITYIPMAQGFCLLGGGHGLV